MKTKYITLLITVLTLSLFSLNCGFLGRKYEKKEISEYKINTAGKNKITLINITGDIKVTKSDSSNLLIIKAEKTAKVRKKELDKPLENLKVIVDTTSDVISIIGEYEKQRGFSFNFSSFRNSIDFEVKLPENIKLTVSNTSGKVDLKNSRNEMDISIVNGSITFDNISGNVSLDVNNGNINGTIDSSKGMKLHVISGSVNLNLDTSYKGVVEAEVVNGRITHEGLNFTQVSEEKKKFRGLIGSSLNETYIEVVNGKIKLQGK